jgi:hypothetical protein
MFKLCDEGGQGLLICSCSIMSVCSHILYIYVCVYFFCSEIEVTYRQEEIVLGSSLAKELYPGDTSKEECCRRADVCGEKPHSFIHIDENAYKCEECTKEFLKISWLVRHRATHTVANPYTCDFCNREFARKVLLEVHIRTHTGKKPFKCSVCSKVFTTCSALTRCTQVHLRTQPQEDAYRCEVCRKIFTKRLGYILYFVFRIEIVCRIVLL